VLFRKGGTSVARRISYGDGEAHDRGERREISDGITRVLHSTLPCKPQQTPEIEVHIKPGHVEVTERGGPGMPTSRVVMEIPQIMQKEKAAPERVSPRHLGHPHESCHGIANPECRVQPEVGSAVDAQPARAGHAHGQEVRSRTITMAEARG
jgi:hypothetical protein